MNFDFTYKSLVELLNKDGVNSKGILRSAFDQASLIDLQILARSINEEIRTKLVQKEKAYGGNNI